jgi:hypothetical protein
MYFQSNYEISIIELKKNGKPNHQHMSFPIITIYYGLKCFSQKAFGSIEYSTVYKILNYMKAIKTLCYQRVCEW